MDWGQLTVSLTCAWNVSSLRCGILETRACVCVLLGQPVQHSGGVNTKHHTTQWWKAVPLFFYKLDIYNFLGERAHTDPHRAVNRRLTSLGGDVCLLYSTQNILPIFLSFPNRITILVLITGLWIPEFCVDEIGPNILLIHSGKAPNTTLMF